MTLRNLLTPLALLGVAATMIYSEAIIAPPVKDGRVHVMYWEKWTGTEGDAIRDVVDTYNRSQNHITVDLLTISSIENKTLLSVAGGDPPDIAGLYGQYVAQYADDNALMSLDDYCARNHISREQYVPVYWDLGTYNGHQYALPSTPSTTALHYNRQLFQKAGLNPDKPPQTIEEMDAMALKLTTYTPDKKLDHSGFLPSEPGWWNWGWGYVFGGKLWDGKTKITANSPENVRAYEWVQAYSKKFGGTNLQSFQSGLGNFSSPQNGFLDGKVAMEIQGVWMYNYITKYVPSFDKPVRNWAAAPFPHPADRPDMADASFAGLDILVIPRGAKHPDEAFAFLKWMESQEGMELLCMKHRKNSPLRNVSANFLNTHPNPFIRMFTDLSYKPSIITSPKIGIWPEYQDAMKNAYDEIQLEKKTPKEALDAVQAAMQPKMDEYLKQLKARREQAARTGNK